MPRNIRPLGKKIHPAYPGIFSLKHLTPALRLVIVFLLVKKEPITFFHAVTNVTVMGEAFAGIKAGLFFLLSVSSNF
jgi:hypothetical protein